MPGPRSNLGATAAPPLRPRGVLRHLRGRGKRAAPPRGVERTGGATLAATDPAVQHSRHPDPEPRGGRAVLRVPLKEAELLKNG